MRFLTIVFASHEEFLAHFSDKHPNGSLFCPTKVVAQVGENVVVDVKTPSLKHPTRLRARVLSHTKNHKNHGLWVYFDAKSSATAEYLRTLATGGGERLSRAHLRYPASLWVRCHIDEDGSSSEVLDGRIVDLSRGGAFISGYPQTCDPSETPLVGTRVSLNIEPNIDTRTSYRVGGFVAWAGNIGCARGFGVCFDQRGTENAALRTMLRKASETGQLSLES